MDETKVENQIWETISRNWRKIPTYFSDTEPVICGVCGNITSETPRNKKGQTVCEATESNCKENCEV
jgi:hypothetical protein